MWQDSHIRAMTSMHMWQVPMISFAYITRLTCATRLAYVTWPWNPMSHLEMISFVYVKRLEYVTWLACVTWPQWPMWRIEMSFSIPVTWPKYMTWVTHAWHCVLFMYICFYVCLYGCTYVRTHVRIYERTHACMYACMCAEGTHESFIRVTWLAHTMGWLWLVGSIKL